MEFKERKPTRLKEYDYSTNGVYFITICTKDRKCILSRIVGDGVLDVPKVVLSEYGRIVCKHLEQISNHYDYLNIDNYVIMPNHMHILMNVCANGMSRTPSPTNNVISSFISTLKRFVNKETGVNLFQRSFYDHIIRDECDYIEHYTYIENNPSKWDSDELYVK